MVRQRHCLCQVWLEALKAPIPIVAIAQEVLRSFVDKNAFQELDHLDLFKGVANGSGAWRMSSGLMIMLIWHLRWWPLVIHRLRYSLYPSICLLSNSALRHCLVGRNLGFFPLDRYAPDPQLVVRATEWLVQAERPLIIAGGGVHISEKCITACSTSGDGLNCGGDNRHGQGHN